MSQELTGLEPKEIRESVALASLFRSCERIRRKNKMSDPEIAQALLFIVNWYDASACKIDYRPVDCSLPVVDMNDLMHSE